MSTTETYSHFRPAELHDNRDCRCGVLLPHPSGRRPERGTAWGSDCPAALREALETAKRERDTERGLADDLRWQRDAAHDQLAEITMDSDAGLALLWMAVFAPGAMRYGELGARMWPDGRDIRRDAVTGVLKTYPLLATYARRTAWATAAVNKLILAGLAEVDPDKGEGWARLTEEGWKLATAWEHTRCMGERDAALARVAELERATPGPHIPPALMRRVEALGFTPGSGEPVGWLVAQVEELVATLANERGEGEPPSEGWAWIDGAWRRTDDNGGFVWSVHNFDPGRWQWRQHDPPYARSRRPMSTARAAIIAAMQAADKARTP